MKKIKGLGDTFQFFTVFTSDCAADNLKKKNQSLNEILVVDFSVSRHTIIKYC